MGDIFCFTIKPATHIPESLQRNQNDGMNMRWFRDFDQPVFQKFWHCIILNFPPASPANHGNTSRR
jgi:hypothetical protein